MTMARRFNDIGGAGEFAGPAQSKTRETIVRKTLIVPTALFGLALTVGVYAAPANAQSTSAEDEVRAALQAVENHHPTRAIQALDRAEAQMVESRAADEERGTRDLPGEPAVIRQMGKARDAIRERHWKQAAEYLNEVRSHPSLGEADGNAAPAVGSQQQ